MFSHGVIAGLLDIIPMVGPIIAGVPAVLLAFTVSPTAASAEAIASSDPMATLSGTCTAAAWMKAAISLRAGASSPPHSSARRGQPAQMAA